jgi:integrase
MNVKELAALIRASGVSSKALASALFALKGGSARTIANQSQAEAAGPGVYPVKDAKGLYLKKTAIGSGSWFFRFRFGGKRPEMGLGALAEVKFAEAVNEALKLKVQVNDGVNPIVARRAAKADTAVKARAEADRKTFAQAVEAYVAAHEGTWKHHNSKRVWLNPIVKYAYPVIGRKLLNDIGVEDIVAIMGATVAGGAPSAGPRIRLRIEQVLNAAIALGQRDAGLGNPATIGLVKAVRPTVKTADEHYRRLNLADAPAVFCDLMARAETGTAFAAWVWAIATATRPGEEALKAKWSEVDFERRTWTVPAARMKGAKGTGREHVVPLSSVALRALEWQRSRRTGDAIFPGSSGSPLSYSAFAKATGQAGLDAGSPHSWRSIFRDWAEEIGGVSPRTAEAALAHSLGKVERAYRRETAIEARRAAMQKYADWLAGESNVVAFPARA